MDLNKTEHIFLTRTRTEIAVVLILGTEIGDTNSTVKSLGVSLNTELKVTEKAKIYVKGVNQLLANITGPRPKKRRLSMSKIHSILLYGTETWAEAMKISKYRKTLV